MVVVLGNICEVLLGYGRFFAGAWMVNHKISWGSFQPPFLCSGASVGLVGEMLAAWEALCLGEVGVKHACSPRPLTRVILSFL